jgi:hypothetical protein
MLLYEYEMISLIDIEEIYPALSSLLFFTELDSHNSLMHHDHKSSTVVQSTRRMHLAC